MDYKEAVRLARIRSLLREMDRTRPEHVARALEELGRAAAADSDSSQELRGEYGRWCVRLEALGFETA